jgi:hypothetical protein
MLLQKTTGLHLLLWTCRAAFVPWATAPEPRGANPAKQQFRALCARLSTMECRASFLCRMESLARRIHSGHTPVFGGLALRFPAKFHFAKLMRNEFCYFAKFCVSRNVLFHETNQNDAKWCSLTKLAKNIIQNKVLFAQLYDVCLPVWERWTGPAGQANLFNKE